MSNHAPKMDTGSKVFLLLSAVALLLTVYVLVSSLINTFQKNMTKGEVDNTMKVASVVDNLKPIGLAATGSAPVAGAAGRAGKEIYDAVCQACHSTGILESPKLGDKATWTTRAANGLDGLLATATNGKGAMPAKGGDPSLTDSELKAVVLYMTKESGLNLGGADKPVASKEPEPAKKKSPSTQAQEASVKPEVKEQPAKAVEEKAVEKVALVAETKAPEATPAVAVATTASNTSAEGKKVYDSACFACHATGVANSPILGNKEAWAARIETGMDALYTTALKGKGAMPPKGGNLTLDDNKVKAAVDYMVSKSQ